MEIVTADMPKSIKAFTFSPRIILSEKKTVAYLIAMKDSIFGEKSIASAEKLGIDIFDLVFIGEKSFDECCGFYLKKLNDTDREVVRTAYLLRKLYSGDSVRISDVRCSNGKAYVKEPEYVYLEIEGDVPKDSDARKSIDEKRERLSKIQIPLNKRASKLLESIRLSALRYGMKNAVENKELIDKYNRRRFSTNLKLNNRPADLEDINAILSGKQDDIIAELTDTKKRISFTVLFALTYGDITIYDLYANDTVFEERNEEKEKKLTDLASNLIDIIINGNRIEIANMFIHMIASFAEMELPQVNMRDMESVMDNYSVYYAIASLANLCENIFKFEGFNGEIKQYLKKHTIENYWNYMDRLMLMKNYSVVCAFCYMLSKFDLEEYREDPKYQGEIMYAFERAVKFAREIREIKEIG